MVAIGFMHACRKLTKHYCLAPSIVLAPIDWAKLRAHPDVDVQRLAKELGG